MAAAEGWCHQALQSLICLEPDMLCSQVLVSSV